VAAAGAHVFLDFGLEPEGVVDDTAVRWWQVESDLLDVARNDLSQFLG